MKPEKNRHCVNCSPLFIAALCTAVLFTFSGCEDRKGSNAGATSTAGGQQTQRQVAPRVDKGEPPQSGRPVRANPTPLVQTIIDNDLDRLGALLDAGADVNEQDENWYSLLHHAASAGQFETIKLLVERGADVNIRARLNVTPLHWAARFNHLEIVQYLVEAGADVNARGGNNNMYTPLGLAADLNYVDIVDYLASVGGQM